MRTSNAVVVRKIKIDFLKKINYYLYVIAVVERN